MIRETDYLDSVGLDRDASARLIRPKDGAEARALFECAEFRKSLDLGPDEFWLMARIQRLQPVQVTTDVNVEWWWFKDNFYKVEFEPGRPSAGLVTNEFQRTKISLDAPDAADEQGYSSEEVAEGVFEMENEQESEVQRASRLDKADALQNQALAIEAEDNCLAEQTPLRDDGFERDDTAGLFTTSTRVFSSEVRFESKFLRSPEVLTRDVRWFDLASQLQDYHPILVTRKMVKGRVWRSEIVTEWWWFKKRFYFAKRAKESQSKSLRKLEEQQGRMNTVPRSVARIPKYGICWDLEYGGYYEDGYSPEEVAWLVFSHEEREKPEERFDRIQVAKDLLSRHHEQPWDEEGDAKNRKRYAAYLTDRNRGYRGDYTKWLREHRKSPRQNSQLGQFSNSSAFAEMSGAQFEQFMAEVFRAQGYEATVVGGSGDQGVDILLRAKGEIVAVQCKNYGKPVGNKPIQEVFAGARHHGADGAWVVAPAGFTRRAIELAQSTGVKLFKSSNIKEWLMQTGN